MNRDTIERALRDIADPRRNEAPKGIEASLQAIVSDAAAKVAPDLALPTVTWGPNTPLRDLLNNAELPAPRELPEHIQRLFFGPRQETADLRITGAIDTRGSTDAAKKSAMSEAERHECAHNCGSAPLHDVERAHSVANACLASRR